MELFRRNSKDLRFVVIKDVVIYVHLSNNIVVIEKQPRGIASQIKKMPGNSTPVIDLTHCSNKAILWLGNSDVYHIIKNVFTVLTGILKHV
jgi:hypothetical protein